MPSYTQSQRAAKLKTPLGEDVLLLSTFVVEEELGRPYTIEVDAVSTEADLDFGSALGLECSISYETISGDIRHFSGVLEAAQWMGERDRLNAYRLTLRPWLWLMTHSGDCKIFQNKSVVDVILDTCRDCGFTDFELQTHETYRTLEYCVQYRESHFAFVSRLMETYGIYYYFRHEEGKHTMVLCDGPGSHSDNPDLGETPYNPSVPRQQFRAQCLKRWAKERSVQTGQRTARAYDFVQPTASMDSHLSEPGGYAHDQMESFEWGDVYKNGETDAHARHFVQARLWAGQSMDQRREATGEAPSLFPGGLTTLKRLRPDSENKSYIVLKAQHAFGAQTYHSDAEGSATDESYTGRYVFQAADRTFKAKQTTPRPAIMGPQTALVVGPEGEEIYCDKYGRIKVQFYWDRVGKNDQNSSCWVRVAQMNVSSSQWGALALPRIGMEVVVQFLDGDPDRPLVTGAVFNGRNSSSYELPAHKTKMVLRSQTYKGSGHNEFSWEDNAGAENVLLRSQKDFTQATLNNYVCNVGANWATLVAGNLSLAVGGNSLTQVGHSQTNIVGGIGNAASPLASNSSSHTNKSHSLAEEAAEKSGYSGDAKSVVMGIIRNGAKALLESDGLKGHNGMVQNGVQTAADMGAQLAGDGATLFGGVRSLFGHGGIQYNLVGDAKIDVIGGVHVETVGAMRTVNVGGANYKKVGGVDLEIVGGTKFVKVAGGSMHRVGGDYAVKVGGSQLHKVASNVKLQAGGDIKTDAGGSLLQHAGGSIKIAADGQLVIGGPGGTITIDGSGITIEGMTINIKAPQINNGVGGATGEIVSAAIAGELVALGESVLADGDAHHE
jgi:type VI secretion system secreted protein VgrG